MVVSLEMLQSRIQEIESSGELDEASKTRLIDLYRKSISLAEQRLNYETAAEEFVKARASAPQQSDTSAGYPGWDCGILVPGLSSQDGPGPYG